MKEIKNFTDLVNHCDGTMNIAQTLGIREVSVIAWNYGRRGIPKKYWDIFIRVFGVPLETLYRVDSWIRNDKR